MPASKAQQKAVAKYVKNNYDIYQIRMPKGKKERIKDYADRHNESMNGFINRVIDEAMEKEQNKSRPVLMIELLEQDIAENTNRGDV